MPSDGGAPVVPDDDGAGFTVDNALIRKLEANTPDEITFGIKHRDALAVLNVAHDDPEKLARFSPAGTSGDVNMLVPDVVGYGNLMGGGMDDWGGVAALLFFGAFPFAFSLALFSLFSAFDLLIQLFEFSLAARLLISSDCFLTLNLPPFNGERPSIYLPIFAVPIIWNVTGWTPHMSLLVVDQFFRRIGVRISHRMTSLSWAGLLTFFVVGTLRGSSTG